MPMSEVLMRLQMYEMADIARLDVGRYGFNVMLKIFICLAAMDLNRRCDFYGQ